MACNICDVSDEEKDKRIKKFSDKIFPIIEAHLEKIPEPAIVAYLMHVCKSIMFNWSGDYYLVLGMLTDMLNDDLQQICEEVQTRKKMKEDTNATDTV